tara:strand:+ start:4971 stop:5777 length:807 start_codon:yes stop_codon:yes gene_type:complete
MPLAHHPDGEIYYELQGTGFPILFLLPQSVGPNGTKALVNSLSRKFSVVLFDQLGTGRSIANSNEYDPSILDRTTEVNCLLDYLDFKTTHLFCHSTGCGLGVSWASSKPARVKTLTLVNPWSYADEQLTTIQRLRIDAAKQLSPYSYAHFNSTILFPAKYKAEYTEAFEAKAIAAERLPHNALQIERRLNSILNFDTRTVTHKVTSPCLVITSKDDILMPSWHADNLAKEIKNTTQYCLNFGGHMLPETRSKRISWLTRKFLLEHSQA